MKAILQEALLDPTVNRYSIVKCVPGKALYLLDHTINMQFKLELVDSMNNETIPTLVNARIFKDAAACQAIQNMAAIRTTRASALPTKSERFPIIKFSTAATSDVTRVKISPVRL